jgi:predicted transcriptional regulator of viral defense system
LADRQHGVVSTRQLRELGLDRFQVARRVQAGFLHPVYRGAYSVGRTGLTRRGRYLAAVLACGPGAVLSHRAAADVWGLRRTSTRVEVTVPATRTGVAGVEVHRTRAVAESDVTVRYGIPITTVARTLLDLAAALSISDLAVAIDRAERQRLLDLREIEDALRRARGKRGAAAVREAIAA